MKYNHKSRQPLRSCACVLVILVSLCWGSIAAPTKIPSSIQLPTINTQKIPLQTQVETKKTSTIGFPDINFEISYSYYTHNGTVQIQNLYKKQKYTENVDQYCKFYKTSILAQTKARLSYEDNVQSLKYTVYHHENTLDSNFYMLGSDSNLYVYGYDKENIKMKGKYLVEYRIGRVRDGELQDNVELFLVRNRLFIANNESLWIFNDGGSNNNYFSLVNGYQPMARIVGAGFVPEPHNNNKLHDSTIWVGSDTQILTLKFTDSANSVNITNILHYAQLPQTISTIIYDSWSGYFYITAARSLYIFKLGNANFLSEYEINGICTYSNLIKSTLYLGCEYQKISFLTELRVQNFTQVVLNRYYDEDFLQGVRDVEYLGDDKIALIGDQQAIIIGQAINRHVLLDLANTDTTQNYEYAYSFSLKDLYYVPHYSTPQHSTLFVVGDASISVHKITFEPPEIQCDFKDHPISTVSVLVLFNTSHCPFLVDAEYELNGTYAICETAFPLRIQFTKKQFEEKTAKIIFFVIMLIGIAGILLCAGFGIKIRNRANALIHQIRQKMDDIRKRHQNSEMKKL